MSNEYMAVKGSNYYLIDSLNDEGYVFNEYGRGIEGLNAKYVMSICNVFVPVDILSILHESTTNISEIYYKGSKIVARGTAINLYKKIPKSYIEGAYIPFRIIRKECRGLSQIIAPLKSNCVSVDMIKEILNIK